MTSVQRAAIGGTLLFVVAVGVRVGLLYRERHADATQTAKPAYKSDPDDLVFLKSEHPMSLADERALKGRTLWASAGGQMDFYPMTARSVDFAHSAGVLLGAEPITVRDAIEQVAPKKTAFRIPAGDRQVLLVFSKGAAATPLYAVPVGYREGSEYTFLTDQIFFYDDPHTLFNFWGADVWRAIDEHRAIPGMTERQVQMALGQVSDPHGDRIGDRMVEYDDGGKPKRVTFAGGKATTIVEARP